MPNLLLILFIWSTWSWTRGHIHVHEIVWYLEIILSILHPWWSSWISDQENATILCDQRRIENCQHLLEDVDVHTTYIQIHWTAIIRLPPFAVSTCYLIIKYFPLKCRLSLAHTDISTPAYTYGTGILEYKYHHSLNTSD